MTGPPNASFAPQSPGFARRLPVGAALLPAGGVQFRVWAPDKRQILLVQCEDCGTVGSEQELSAEGNGYHSGYAAAFKAGDLYGYRFEHGGDILPDPASRFQPFGPLGPSEVVDPSTYKWADAPWTGLLPRNQIFYEMHIGTFSQAGTFVAAQEQLAELARIGITVIELMPLADFSGQFGWGYDGTCLFAPTRLFGRPDDVRQFVDRAHAVGVGVILDVVYNHLGPVGQTLERFSDHYFTDRYTTDWGAPFNFDGPNSDPVREFFLANAAYWIDEFHFDGLRIDATQNIYDSSADHIISAIARTVRAAGGSRTALLVAENELQQTQLVRPPEQGGMGLDLLWNDDFHHSAMAALSGRNEAYYTDYRGAPQEFISSAKYGYLYQGQWYKWQKKRRGTPGLDLPPAAFINYIQNHDQIGNSIRGQRCHELTSPGLYRAMTALLLLAPGTPMLFQGQEFASSKPFCYFADQGPTESSRIRQGRVKFLAQFASLNNSEAQGTIPDPSDPETFKRCKLDFAERRTHAGIYRMHHDLLKLRRTEPTLCREQRGRLDGAVLGPEAFVLRYFGDSNDDRILLVNFGIDVHFNPAPEPLLAPPIHRIWEVQWSSENPIYGGGGTPALESEDNWLIPGHAAILLMPRLLDPVVSQATVDSQSPVGTKLTDDDASLEKS